MKLGLIGKNISHSRSPAIYKKLISANIEYSLIDANSAEALPSVLELKSRFDGINITSPYKRHYVNDVHISDVEVKQLGAINCLSFTAAGVFATNTDLLAVRSILKRFKANYSSLHLIILGRGVMGQLTEIVASGLGLSFVTLERKNGLTANCDLRPYQQSGSQNLIINACSRDLIFTGELAQSSIFWDYNYNFLPHQNTLPFRVKMYIDGQEMLWLQAQAAVEFWNTTKR